MRVRYEAAYRDALDDHHHRIPLSNLDWMTDEAYQPIESPFTDSSQEELTEAAEGLRYLLPKEKELLALRALGLRQVEIAKRLGYHTQGAVSHMLQRILKKIRFHSEHGHTWSEDEIYQALTGFKTIEPYYGPRITRHMAATVVFRWATGSSFVGAGRKWALSFSQSRHTIHKALETLQETNQDLASRLQALLAHASRRLQGGLGPQSPQHLQHRMELRKYQQL
jgi:DNA-binding CsgD family transcriptional regulator